MTAIDGLIADSFDRRTLANMEVALERALQRAGADAERHALRAHVASGILACAKTGDTTLGALTRAGRAAADEMRPGSRRARHGGRN